MKIISGKDIPPRVLIKKIETPTKIGSGLEIPMDTDNLPKAKIIMVAETIEDIVKVGDIVYYLNARDLGKCLYKGEEHYISSIGNIIAIL